MVPSMDVWHWPEFKAFMGRLGVRIQLPTQSLTIKMDHDSAVKVYQGYMGRDMNTDSDKHGDEGPMTDIEFMSKTDLETLREAIDSQLMGMQEQESQ